MLSASPRSASGPVGTEGRRAYVIGDVHGRLDLLDRLLAAIDAEIAARPVDRVLLAFLGDLIDRGPSSAGVIERLRTYRHPGVQPVFVLGNHEEVLLRILAGESGLIQKWLWFGGAQCIESYGVELESLKRMTAEDALERVRAAIPDEHVQFLRAFVDSCRFGDFLFVHAGIRPGIALEGQQQSDLRWIREPFLHDDSDHGFVVVHGHTISPEVQERGNRIGIDTGAYKSGVLTALAIEEDRRWFIDTGASPELVVTAAH
jgi:serine/threonine protein phosphatase 1